MEFPMLQYHRIYDIANTLYFSIAGHIWTYQKAIQEWLFQFIGWHLHWMAAAAACCQ